MSPFLTVAPEHTAYCPVLLQLWLTLAFPSTLLTHSPFLLIYCKNALYLWENIGTGTLPLMWILFPNPLLTEQSSVTDHSQMLGSMASSWTWTWRRTKTKRRLPSGHSLRTQKLEAFNTNRMGMAKVCLLLRLKFYVHTEAFKMGPSGQFQPTQFHHHYKGAIRELFCLFLHVKTQHSSLPPSIIRTAGCCLSMRNQIQNLPERWSWILYL